MDVYCGSPLRTSRHTGALFPGCVCWRCVSAWAEPGAGSGADCCATLPGMKSTPRARTNRMREKTPAFAAIAFIRGSPRAAALLGPGVFVLILIADLERVFPAGLITLGPRLRSIHGCARI